MKQSSKRLAVLLSEVASSNEVTIMNADGTIKRIGKYREMFGETENHDRFYQRLALLIKEKRVYIL